MAERIESLLDPPISFIDGGAGLGEQPDSPEAHELVLGLGASGLETNAHLSRDQIVVLGVADSVRRGLRRVAVSSLDAAELDDTFVRLSEVEEMYRRVGVPAGGLHVSLSVASDQTFDAIIDTQPKHEQQHREHAVPRLWVRAASIEKLVSWRRRWPGVGLIHDTTLTALTAGPERHAATMSDQGLDGIRLPYPDWTGGLATLFHRFELLAFGYGAVHDRMFDDMIRMGLDGISSRYADRLVDAFERRSEEADVAERPHP